MSQNVKDGLNSVMQLQDALEKAQQYPTGKLWVDCVVLPVIIIYLFVHAEREGNWLLYLYCMKRMTVYFMAAGHWNYARYISWFVNTEFDEESETVFMKGDNVCHHKPGTWNRVSADQFGEQTYIRFGKSKGGMVDVTLFRNKLTSGYSHTTPAPKCHYLWMKCMFMRELQVVERNTKKKD